MTLRPAAGHSDLGSSPGTALSPVTCLSIFLENSVKVLYKADDNHQSRTGHANEKHPFKDRTEHLHEGIHFAIVDRHERATQRICRVGRWYSFRSCGIKQVPLSWRICVAQALLPARKCPS